MRMKKRDYENIYIYSEIILKPDAREALFKS